MEVQLRVGKFFVRKKQKLDFKGELAVFAWRRAWKPPPRPPGHAGRAGWRLREGGERRETRRP